MTACTTMTELVAFISMKRKGWPVPLTEGVPHRAAVRVTSPCMLGTTPCMLDTVRVTSSICRVTREHGRWFGVEGDDGSVCGGGKATSTSFWTLFAR